MICLLLACLVTSSLQSDAPGHNKPFGWGDVVQVEEVQGFLPVAQFFQNYARKNRPVVMRGANRVWPAFQNWQTDEYFKSVLPVEPYMVSLEMKLDDESEGEQFADFKEFLKTYKETGKRMIEKTPKFLWDDVYIPASLDCEAITQGEILMGNKLWIVHNESKTLVRKDAADNIHCLVYGAANYTLLPTDQSGYPFLDRPDGLYSTMDVDRVDFDKYPGLEKVQYQISELRGGDCIFVPYKWVHQVRSYGRNLALNFWWNYWKNNEFDVSACPETIGVKHTIDQAKYYGWGEFESSYEGVKEHVTDMLKIANRNLNQAAFSVLLSLGSSATEIDEKYIDDDLQKALGLAFKAADANRDGIVNYQELKTLPQDRMEKLVEHMKFVLYMTRVRYNSQKEAERDEALQEKFGNSGKFDLEKVADREELFYDWDTGKYENSLYFSEMLVKDSFADDVYVKRKGPDHDEF